jgi:hypothetical protein
LTSGRAPEGFTTFSEHILQHRLIQAQIGDQLLQPAVLLLELLHLTGLIGLYPHELFLPWVEGRFADPTFRITSTSGTPSSACFSTATISPIEKRFFFMQNLL